jgi:hypothetical protein
MTTAGNFGEVTDKAAHGYFPAYMAIAADLGPRAHVCELGVWHGDSLRLWQALFPFGEVTGVDHDPGAAWPPGTRRIVMEATDSALPEALGGPFGLIVDDASHLGSEATAAFTSLWPLVAPGGYYAIEDWYVAFKPGFYGYAPGDESMLDAVAALLRMMDRPGSDVEWVTYRYGLAVVHRKRG